MTAPSARRAEVSRRTCETTITVALDLDGEGRAEIESGIGFLDHMLTSLARHARFDLRLTCQGSRSARRSTGRSANAAASPGSARPMRRSTRRWRAPWWISRAGRAR